MESCLLKSDAATRQRVENASIVTGIVYGSETITNVHTCFGTSRIARQNTNIIQF